MPKVRVTPIIGLPQFDGWSQVVESPPHSSVKIVLSIAIEGTQAGNVGRDIANFFSSQVIQTLEEFHELLEEIIDQAAENGVHTLFSAGYFSGEACAYATFNGAVLLKRDSKIGTILSSGHQLKLITGKVALHDVVVFSTLSAARFFTEIELKFEQGYDADTIVASVVPGLHAEDNSSLSALAFITFEEEKNVGFRESVVGHQYEHHQHDKSTRPVSQRTSVSALETSSESEMSEDVDDSLVSDPVGTASGVQIQEDVAHELSSSLEETEAPKSSFSFSDLVGSVTRALSLVGRVLSGGLKKVQVLVPPIVRAFRSLRTGAGRAFSGERRTSIIGFFKDLPDTLKSLIPSKDVYLETSNTNRIKRARAGIVVITIIICAAAVVLLVISKRNSERSLAEENVRPLLEEVTSAQAMAQDQPLEARNVASEALRKLEDLQSQHEEGSISYQVISDAYQEASTIFTSISGMDALQELPVFYDLRLVSSDFIASKMLLNQEKLYFVDTEQKTIVSLEVGSKKAAKASVSTESLLVDTTIFENAPLFLTTAGIGSVPDFSQETEEIEYQEEIPEGDSNRNARFITSYENYLYVVNPEKRNIYRYSYGNDGFSDPIGWMQEVSRGLDFADVASISVDGDVWLGMNDGRILKFTRGRSEDFAIKAIQQQFDSSVIVRSVTDGKYLFVLEPARSRVVVLLKTGEFIKEISNTSLGAVTDIIPSSDELNVYAISGSVVYRLDI